LHEQILYLSREGRIELTWISKDAILPFQDIGEYRQEWPLRAVSWT
jgi:hypothetical protein